MVESLQINKVQVKEKLIVDTLAKMTHTEDFDFKVGKKGTEIWPDIIMARSAITHSRQFFEINPI